MRCTNQTNKQKMLLVKERKKNKQHKTRTQNYYIITLRDMYANKIDAFWKHKNTPTQNLH